KALHCAVERTLATAHVIDRPSATQTLIAIRIWSMPRGSIRNRQSPRAVRIVQMRRPFRLFAPQSPRLRLGGGTCAALLLLHLPPRLDRRRVRSRSGPRLNPFHALARQPRASIRTDPASGRKAFVIDLSLERGERADELHPLEVGKSKQQFWRRIVAGNARH